MPAYSHLIEQPLDFTQSGRSMAALAKVGVPYDSVAIGGAEAAARAQAATVFAQLVAENGNAQGVESVRETKVIAVIAYLQRLGTDLNKPIDVAPAATSGGSH